MYSFITYKGRNMNLHRIPKYVLSVSLTSYLKCWFGGNANSNDVKSCDPIKSNSRYTSNFMLLKTH